MQNPTKQMLDLAQIVLEAGVVIMEIYESDFETIIKNDETPVTKADMEAETVILARLKQLDGETPVIAEEAVAGGKIPKAAPRFYLVDPVDGTKEFINRNGEFTVNIGLIENGVPVCGVVFAPAIKRMFVGAKGHGAFEAYLTVEQRLDEATWQPIKALHVPTGDVGGGVVGVASRSHRDEQTEKWLAERGVEKIVSAGSSLKFCLVAAGEAHLYPRFGRTMEWDTAAGHGVVLGAGGQVVTENGEPLLYGKEHRGFDNPAFFASAS